MRTQLLRRTSRSKHISGRLSMFALWVHDVTQDAVVKINIRARKR
jgi:hypothetical protein